MYSDVVLEKISKSIGNFFSGTQIISLLGKSGIPRTWIEYPATKWRMVNEVFAKCKKQKNGDRKITDAILVFTHPLNHWDEEKSCDSFRAKIRKYLNYDNLSLVCGLNGQCAVTHATDSENIQQQAKQGTKRQEKKPTSKDIDFWERYQNDYKQLMKIVEIFLKNKECIDDSLNTAYRTLKSRLEENMETFLPYIPFGSLFSAEKEWADYTQDNILLVKTEFSWSTFRPKLQDTYSKILERLEETRKATGINKSLTSSEIDDILKGYPETKESEAFIQKMEVTHKFEKQNFEKNQKKSLSEFETIDFKNDDLIFDKRRVSLIKHPHGKQIAGFLMKKLPHEKTDWSEIYENTIGNDIVIAMPKKDVGWRKIRDASEEINNKIINELGLKSTEKFIDWDQNCFWRTR